MPIYEYQCGDCGHKLEVIQRVADAPPTTCPACAKEALKKLISPVGFQLKGTGWYVTDFRDKDKPKSAKSADKDGGESKSGAADGAATDAKPETAKSDGSASDAPKSASKATSSAD